MRSTILVVCFLLGTCLVTALPFHFRLSPYAPIQTQCPSTPLVRPAHGLSDGEMQYMQQRRAETNDNLRAFYLRLNADRPADDLFPTLNATMPVMAFASSGGGVRAMLAGAGVIQALDKRDHTADTSPLSGLWQCFCYHSGLSGGSWLLGSMAGNENATISSLATDLWISGFSGSNFFPYGKQGPETYPRLFLDVIAKIWSGFPTSLVDTWGRVVSLHTLLGDDSGVDTTLSGVTNSPDFQNYQMPYPIITALAVNPVGRVHECIAANLDSPQYEFHPYESGSWDPAIRSFGLTRYLGTLTNGDVALSLSSCVEGFDTLSFLMGSSSNLLSVFCGQLPQPNVLSGELGQVQSDLVQMTAMAKSLSFMDEYGIIPVSQPVAQAMSASNNIYLVDGGEGNENVPLWPLIQPERGIDVIWVNDNSADTSSNWPNGSSLSWTYRRAVAAGLDTMPVVPTPEEIVQRFPSQMPFVLGCYDVSKITLIVLNNKGYSFDSNIPTWILLYTSEEVQRMIQNSNLVAALGNDPTWPTCLGCFMINRSNQGQGLPSFCADCFDRFCWKGMK